MQCSKKNQLFDEPVLYLDCSSGISGDMTVGALLDLGADETMLRSVLATLPLEGWKIAVSRVKKSGIDACDFNVILDEENHDHDMAWLHGDHSHSDQAHGHDHAHIQDDHRHDHTHLQEDHQHDHAHIQDDHHHDHAHLQDDHHHGHHGRNLADITAILKAGSLTPRALELALAIFRIVAEAESRSHGLPIDQVHFHEVGAVDSIIDIAASAICLDDLNIRQVIIPSLTEGNGQIRCQHGLLPVPVPATSAIASAYHLPLHISNVQGELITPTGAAIAAAIRTSDALPETFTIEKTGLGAGKRDYATSGILRAMIIRQTGTDGRQLPRSGEEHLIREAAEKAAEGRPGPESGEKQSVLKLETNIDDSTGEALGFVMEELLAAGALDVYYTPVFMKKNRPAWMLSVLCRARQRPAMEALIFRHTTSIGIRCQEMERSVLSRQSRTVPTPWGDVRVKECSFNGETWCYPEHDSIAALARQNHLSYEQLYHEIRRIAENIRETPIQPTEE